MPPKVISASQINQYKNCPRSYYLKYILGLKEPVISQHMLFGSKIHDMISKGIFISEDPREQGMLTIAKDYLNSMPNNGISETTYEDKNNPGRFYGDVLGQRCVGVFDIYWEPKVNIGCDYKTGSLYKTFTGHHEIQAWILNELYKQKYDEKLKSFVFKFLKTNQTYEAKCINDPKEHKKTENGIKKVLFNIEEGNYDKKKGKLCETCGLACYCSMEI